MSFLNSLMQIGGIVAAPFTGGASLALTAAGTAANATEKAANTQASAARDAAALAAQQKQPWVDAGKIGLDALTTGIKPGGQFNKQFTMADAQNSDAMKFTLEQGMGALKNSEAMKGGLLGTNALNEQTKFAEGVASTFQNQAFNQWLAQQQQLLGATESLAQTGQTASSQVADTGANALLAAGGAQAGATAAQGNIYSNLISGVGNNTNVMDSLSKLFGTGGSTPSALPQMPISTTTPFGQFSLGGP